MASMLISRASRYQKTTRGGYHGSLMIASLIFGSLGEEEVGRRRFGVELGKDTNSLTVGSLLSCNSSEYASLDVVSYTARCSVYREEFAYETYNG